MKKLIVVLVVLIALAWFAWDWTLGREEDCPGAREVATALRENRAAALEQIEERCLPAGVGTSGG